MPDDTDTNSGYAKAAGSIHLKIQKDDGQSKPVARPLPNHLDDLALKVIQLQNRIAYEKKETSSELLGLLEIVKGILSSDRTTDPGVIYKRYNIVLSSKHIEVQTDEPIEEQASYKLTLGFIEKPFATVILKAKVTRIGVDTNGKKIVSFEFMDLPTNDEDLIISHVNHLQRKELSSKK